MQSDTEQSFFVVKLIWALVLFLTGAVALYLIQSVGLEPLRLHPFLIILSLFSLLSFFAALRLPGWARLHAETVWGEGIFARFRELTPARKAALLYCVSFSLFETVALYGALSAVLVSNREVALPFFLLSLIGLFSHFPRRSQMDELAKAFVVADASSS